MKKFIITFCFLLGLAASASATKYLVAWAETSKDCISFIIIVTEDNGEYIGAVSGQTGSGCGSSYVNPDPDTPKDILMRYPQIQREIDKAYDEYQSQQ